MRDRTSRAIAVRIGKQLFLLSGLGVIGGLLAAPAASAQSVEQLRSLSIEQLSNIEVSSVSKSAEPLSDAAAAIYVITHDDIIRSGATTIPEILRLAPNLEVAEINGTTYAISARGFNVGNNASMSDKLLVLIDGRSVYTPLFAGVYWDMQGVLPEDIDRIEVISGPGATLWGANAVNGVINIITRNSADTQGGVLTMGAGNLERSGSLQYGGRVNDALTYRFHIEGQEFSPQKNADGSNAQDGWSKPQGGFRFDWSRSTDTFSLQGDAFEGNEVDQTVGGRDLVANWQHQLTNGSLQFQAYYDHAERLTDDDLNGSVAVDTGDFSVQHSFSLNNRNAIVWGGGERVFGYDLKGTSSLSFVPAARVLNLTNIFGQDTITLTDKLKATVGLKIEQEAYGSVEPLPSLRLSYKPVDSTLFWTAVSRAVRAPTPVDRDIREFVGGVDFLKGSPNFMPETLTAFEAGTRVQASQNFSFSISTFYNIYDDLRSLEVTPGTLLPLTWGNLMAGQVYGVESWADYRPTSWWRLTAGFNIQHESLRFLPGSSQLGGLALAADDPNHQASLRSYINLGKGVTWDAALRYVGKLHNPSVPEYAELDMRIGWKVSDRLEVSLSGFNLLHAHHLEFVELPQSDEVSRSFFLQTRWRF